MSDVNVQLVREFFEFNSFRVMTYWQQDMERPRATEHGLQLFVENGATSSTRKPDFVLRAGDISEIRRALVEVRAWHADRFYASVIESNPVLFEVAGEESRMRAQQEFGTDDFDTILVISELPSSPDARDRSVALLQQGGIGHIIEFPAILQDLLDKVNPYVSYAPSHTLQTLRLLKRYDLLRWQQLEFPFNVEAPGPAVAPDVVTLDTEDDRAENP